MSNGGAGNKSGYQPYQQSQLGSIADAEIGLGDMVKRVTSALGILIHVVMVLLALRSGAVAQIVDVSPTVTSFTPLSIFHSVSGRILSLAVSADPAPGCFIPGRRCTVGTPPGAPIARLYAGTFAGVWRSDDAGRTWRQLMRPQPPEGTNIVPGALMVPNVFDLAVSQVNRDLVFAATAEDTRSQSESKNGIYRSADGGETWSLVHQFACSGKGPVGQIVFAPDDPNLLFAAGDCSIAKSTDAGLTWTDTPISGRVWHVAVAPQQGPVRRVYAAGDGQMWYSQDGGQSWYRDGASIPNIAGGIAGVCCGSSAHVLAVEPGQPDHVYLAVPGLANGRSYYHPSNLGPDGQPANTPPGNPIRPAGEGSLWLGDFSDFVVGDPARRAASWTQLPGPPLYYWVSTDSGNVYVEAKPTAHGYLLFFSDRAHVHVSAGRPTPTSWHRLDGRDVSQGRLDGCFGNDNNSSQGCNLLFLHVDPHALAVSKDFNITLKPPTGVSFPYDQNAILDGYIGGSIWMANDGGVYFSSDAGQFWDLGAGLATLAPANVAGVAMLGRQPALYMGTGDNNCFYSLNGGTNWEDPVYHPGDCDPWFADPAQPSRVLSFEARAAPPGFGLYVAPTGGFPDAGILSQHRAVPAPSGSNAVSFFSLKGYRPIVSTFAGENPLDDGDYILIRTKSDGTRGLLRTTSISTISSPTDWDNPSKAAQQGPSLPLNVDVVQAAGGHASPVFYVGDPSSTQGLWRWTNGMSGWQQIVPSAPGNPFCQSETSATKAIRFFASPYDPNLIYIIDQDHIKRSDDGGCHWHIDTSLDAAATENGDFAYDGGGSVLKDMVFDRGEPETRFAIGNAGVFFTLDGVNWNRLLSTTALPSRPISAYFDSVSGPALRALYVATDGRGVLEIEHIPPPPQLSQYAVKFICGKPSVPVVSPGQYFTAINIHNPAHELVKFRKKVAIALPQEKAGTVTSFFPSTLKPDEALEIDCQDILNHAESRGQDFLKGFVVIETPSRVDAVATYTAAGSTGSIETLFIERVSGQPLAQPSLPDLVPVNPRPPDALGFCRLDQQGRLLLAVRNQGTAPAGASLTTVTFAGVAPVTVTMLPIPAGSSTDLSPVSIPGACFVGSQCRFQIVVNSSRQVEESNYENNTADGLCIIVP
jgi:hypothetical protein